MDIQLPGPGAMNPGPVGVFDSGFGGLSVLADLQRALPQADFIYLGDNEIGRASCRERVLRLV